MDGAVQRGAANVYGGQLIWVHPAMDLGVATISTVSPDSQQRGHALQLISTQLYAAARRRVAVEPK